SMDGLVEIAPLPAVPLRGLFTYRVPGALRDRVRPGMRVRIPLGRQTRMGVVAGFTESAPGGDLRSVIDCVDPEPLMPPDLLELCRWTARYYLVSLADVIGTIVPSGLAEPAAERVLVLARRLTAEDERTLARRAPARARAYQLLASAEAGQLTARALRAAGIEQGAIAGLVRAGLAEARRVPRSPAAAPVETAPSGIALTDEQRAAADAIVAAVREGAQRSFLLHGITGSGKTEVFLTAADDTLAAGGDVLVLVPEIALTHQLVSRVRGRFGDLVAVLHSGLSPRERWAEWRRIRAREARVVVGARSAVFAPLGTPRLIVVDEEHDAAYKQEDGIRYNARDLAVVRARLAGGVAVLASAAPAAGTHPGPLHRRHPPARSRLATHSAPPAHGRSDRPARGQPSPARRGAPVERGPCGAREQPRRAATDARVPEPARLRHVSPVSRLRHAGKLPAVQR